MAVGGRVTVTVQVTNTGLLPATGVSVVISQTAGTGTLGLLPGPVANMAANGGTATFVFTYSGTSAGSVGFSVQAWGTDTSPACAAARVSPL